MSGTMPKSKTSTTIRQTWRDESSDDVRIARQRLAIRLTFTAFTLALASALAYLLFTPLFHPKMRLYFLTASIAQQVDVAPMAFFQDDALKFLSADGSFQPADASSEFFLLESPEAAQSALTKLAASAVDASDVLFVYISAYPAVSDGEPYLRCDNFSPTNPSQGMLALTEVFDRLSQTQAGTIVVLLDAGREAGSAASTENADRFLTLTQSLVSARNSDALYVISANAPGEHSYRSLRRNGSFFVQSVHDGLAGYADLDGDRLIRLDEFYNYIANATKEMVAKESAGAAQQTPQLFAPQLATHRPAQRRVLASAPRHSSGIGELIAADSSGMVPDAAKAVAEGSAAATAEQAEAEAAKQQAAKSSLMVTLEKKAGDAKESAIEELTENINILPTFLANRVKRSIGLSADPSRVERSDGSPAAPQATAADDSGSTNTATDADADAATDTATAEGAQQNEATTEDANGSETVSRSLPDLSQLGSADQSPAQLIQLAWQFTDYLENSERTVRRPIEQAPHAWAAWIVYLHGVEEANRTGAIVDVGALRVELTAEIVAAYQLAVQQTVTTGVWLKRVGAQLPSYELPNQLVTTLGLAETIAASGGPALPARLSQQIRLYELSLAAADRKLFDEWLEQASAADVNQYAEFFYARELGQLSELPWAFLQTSLTCRRQLERLLAQPLASNAFVVSELTRAQRELLEATRCAMDQIAIGWREKSAELLQHAQQSVQRAQELHDRIAHAVELRNQLLIDFPHMLQWRAAAIERLGNRDIDFSIDQLLQSLEKLNRELVDLDEVDPAGLQFVTREAQQWKLSVEQSWRQTAASVLDSASRSTLAPEWTVDALLSTPLVRDALRNRLLTLTLDADSNEAPVQVAPRSRTTLPVSNWNAAKASKHRDRQSELNERLIAVVHLQQDQSQIVDKAAMIQTLVDRKTSDLDARLKTLGQADTIMRILSAQEALRFDGQTIESELQQLRLLSALQSKLGRFVQSFPDALPSELPWLRGQQERLNQLVGRLSQDAFVTVDVPPRVSSGLVAGGTSTVSLIAEPIAEAEVSWRNVAGPLEDVWLVVDYDPSLVAIESNHNTRFYHASLLPKSLDQIVQAAEQDLALALHTAQQSENVQAAQLAQQRLAEVKASRMYPLRPDSGGLRSSTELLAGQELRIPFKVRRIGSGSDHTKVVWKLIGKNEYLRHETLIRLPETEKLRLQVEGPEGSFAQTSEGVVLHLWPNRTTEFRLGLASIGAQPRSVSVEVLALGERNEVTFPDGFVDDETSREILGRLGPTSVVSSLPMFEVGGDEQVDWLSLGDAKPNAAGADGAKATAAGGEAAASADTKEDAAAKSIDIRNGLAIVLTDLESKQQMWRRVDTRVRHPRSYVMPIISYDSVAERIEVHLKPTGPLSAVGNNISVTGHVVGGVPQGTEMLLEGNIIDNQGVKLFCQLPVTAPPDLTLALDVDEFPRAFVFKVPCWRTQKNIPYQAGDQRIAIMSPAAGTALGPEADSQTIELQVDTIAGAFASPRDSIEVGWDVDRDREFSQERTIRIGADRNVDVALEIPRGDRFTFSTVVHDLSVTLPPPPMDNARINLLAKLTSSGETVWSQPVEIIVDSDPPTITGIGVLPASPLMRGTDVTVRVNAEDAGLSGVESIELMRDIKFTGQWDDQSPPIACERTVEGDWIGKVPTKELSPGRVNYLARATDRVGNRSELAKFNLEIFSEEQWAARLAQTGQEVSGTLIYADAPLPNAKITLEDDKGKVAYTASTNAQGMFRLSKVAVGKYKVVAIGVSKNRPRISESQLEVPPPPAPPIRLRLQAK